MKDEDLTFTYPFEAGHSRGRSALLTLNLASGFWHWDYRCPSHRSAGHLRRLLTMSHIQDAKSFLGLLKSQWVTGLKAVKTLEHSVWRDLFQLIGKLQQNGNKHAFKRHFLHSYLEHGRNSERLDRYLMSYKDEYRGFWDKNILTDYC